MLSLTVCFISWFHLHLEELHQSGLCGLLMQCLGGKVHEFISLELLYTTQGSAASFLQIFAYSQLPNTLAESTACTRIWARRWSWFNVKIDQLCTGSFSHISQVQEDGLVSLTACNLAWWFQKMTRSRRLCCHWTSLVGIPKVMLSSFMICWRRWLASWIPRYVTSESKSFWKYLVSVKNPSDKLSLKLLM